MGLDVVTENCTIAVQAKTAVGYVFTLFEKQKDDPSDNFKVKQDDLFC